jgi:hypothetical protein
MAMSSTRVCVAAAILGFLTLVAPAGAQTPGSFELVGHEPLLNRGMNAALAVHGNYAYVGSRTDGKDGNANNAGVMVVDIKDPAHPRIARQIGPPLEGNPRESSRELRVWHSQNILIVLHTNCGGATAHLCAQPSNNNFRFYDVSGDRAADPRLILELDRNTHEFFLWEDPYNPRRALMFAGGAGATWQIYDLSPLLEGQPPAVLFDGRHEYSGGLHSLSVSNDGTRAYFALLTGGFAIADVSDFTVGRPNPQYRMITPPANRPTWPGPGAHSAIKLWNKDWVYVSDEVYGTATADDHGCPWGWARFIDIADPTRPAVRAEYRLPQNQPALCSLFEPRPRTSFSAHNPTLTPNIAFSTWHSGGLQAIGIDDPARPDQLAQYMPEPLPTVGTEDPRLSSDDQKVVMWSYPIIKDGLIYVADLRNGLYILRYSGPFQDEVASIGFLEGNSNQGDALCYEPVGSVPRSCKSQTSQPVGGTVPATLSLTLGAPASFGAFTPGVARDYFASTAANVTSTAGDALLQVGDTTGNATGQLVNGAYALPLPLQARARNAATPGTAYRDVGASLNLLTWSAPVSNDAVTLEFKQSIRATDPLRTGAYSKTLTFTLSTTLP